MIDDGGRDGNGDADEYALASTDWPSSIFLDSDLFCLDFRIIGQIISHRIPNCFHRNNNSLRKVLLGLWKFGQRLKTLDVPHKIK